MDCPVNGGVYRCLIALYTMPLEANKWIRRQNGPRENTSECIAMASATRLTSLEYPGKRGEVTSPRDGRAIAVTLSEIIQAPRAASPMLLGSHREPIDHSALA